MANKSYAEKLRDPRWQRKRLEIMNRDNFTCTICQDKESTLNVHHLEYKGDPWEQDDDKLQTVCEACHTKISKPDSPLGRLILSDRHEFHHEQITYFHEFGVHIMPHDVMISHQAIQRIYKLSLQNRLI